MSALAMGRFVVVVLPRFWMVERKHAGLCVRAFLLQSVEWLRVYGCSSVMQCMAGSQSEGAAIYAAVELARWQLALCFVGCAPKISWHNVMYHVC